MQRSSRLPHLTALLCGLSIPSAVDAQTMPRAAREELRTEIRGAGLDTFRTQSMAVAPDGLTYVLDSRLRTVLVYRDGGHAARVLTEATGLAGGMAGAYRIRFRGDTLVAYGTSSMYLFHRDGRPLRTSRVAVPVHVDGMSVATPAALLTGGNVLAIPSYDTRRAGEGTLRQLPLLRTNERGDRLGSFGMQNLRNSVLMVRLPGGGFSFTRQPWRDDDLVLASGRGDVVVTIARAAASAGGRGQFRVVRMSPSGDTMSARAYPYTPRRLTAEISRRTIRRTVERYFRTEAGIEAPLREALYEPEFIPPVSDALVGRDGTLWLRREDAGDPTVAWTVISARGDVVAEVSLPASLRIFEATAERAWGVADAPSGREMIVRYVLT
jgi:hypothetical protein